MGVRYRPAAVGRRIVQRCMAIRKRPSRGSRCVGLGHQPVEEAIRAHPPKALGGLPHYRRNSDRRAPRAAQCVYSNLCILTIMAASSRSSRIGLAETIALGLPEPTTAATTTSPVARRVHGRYRSYAAFCNPAKDRMGRLTGMRKMSNSKS